MKGKGFSANWPAGQYFNIIVTRIAQGATAYTISQKVTGTSYDPQFDVVVVDAQAFNGELSPPQHTNVGGTLHKNNQLTNSNANAIVPKAGAFPVRTDAEIQSSKKHLNWLGDRTRYKMLQSIDYASQSVPTSVQPAYFSSTAKVPVKVSLDGTAPVTGLVDIRDPWYVNPIDGTQPDNF
jgi:hypothetical protein